MKVKFLGFKKDDGSYGQCRIKGNLYEPEKEYEVDEGLANWLFAKELATKIEEEVVPELFIEPSAPSSKITFDDLLRKAKEEEEGLPLHLREVSLTPKTEVKPAVEVEVKPPEVPPKPADRKVVEDYVITKLDETRFRVYNILEDKSYVVEPYEMVCSCPDWKFRGVERGFKCKHVSLVQEQFGIKPKEIVPAEPAEEISIIVDQGRLLIEMEPYLRDEIVERYVYAFESRGKEITGLTAAGARDLAHMIAERYSLPIELGDLYVVDAGDKWVAKVKVTIGNFTAYGTGDCDKSKPFAYRIAASCSLRNAYRAVVPEMLQRAAIDKFIKLRGEGGGF